MNKTTIIQSTHNVEKNDYYFSKEHFVKNLELSMIPMHE